MFLTNDKEGDSMNPMKKHLAAVLVLVFSLILGIWCGEDLKTFLGISVSAAIAAGVLLLLGLALYRKVMQKFLMTIAVITLLVAGYFFGMQQAQAAFNDGVVSGELMRVVLLDYRSRHGVFPEELDELDDSPVRKRLLRGSVMDYRRTESGYELSFGDWMISHHATESLPFHATK
jgi:hypothetical protein